MKSAPAVEVTNLKVQYPGTKLPAVENINFTIAPHQIAAIIGPNGSGKSSVVKAMLNLIPHQGQVRFSNKPLNQLKHQIGYVPQRFSFDRTIPVTVYEFLRLTLTTCSHAADEQRHMIKSVLTKLDISSLQSVTLSSLSGGQLQKVLLARALVHKPNFLILDEPEAGVDAGGELVFYNFLEQLVKQGNITAIIVSHELEIVQSYADQVICINRQLVCSGQTDKVLNQDTFKKLYGTGIAFYQHAHHSHH